MEQQLEEATAAAKRAGVAAQKIIGSAVAEEIAERIKDRVALERALISKLEAQRDFAAEYQRKFPLGRNQHGYDMSVAPSEWCASHGFHQRTVQRWLCLLQTDVFSKEVKAIEKRCWRLVEMEQAANFMSESVEWYTPKKYLDAVHEVLGGVDLDPASNKQANENVRAVEFFTADQDGLEQDWWGRVFLNPPYGKSEEHGSLAGAFCNKAMAEYESGNVQGCIVLVNSLHSQNWQAALYDYTVCFVDHRIQFISGDGEENKNPTFQNIFVYMGDNNELFAKAFSKFGYVMRKVEVGS